MSYSLDYRERVMAIKAKEKLTYEATSKRFGVSMRTLFNWKQNIKPQKTRNKPATKVDMDGLKADVEKYADSYPSERAKRFGVSVSGIFYALKRLKISYKKNSESSEGGRGGTYSIPDQDDAI